MSITDEKRADSLQLFPHHLQKLTGEHGLTLETIHEAGLFSAAAKTLDEILNRNDIICEGIVIPYGDGFSRVRLDAPLMLNNGRQAKYLSPSGSKNRLYIPNSVRMLLKDPLLPIYLTEGEFKALKLTQEGFPCLGIPGAWGFSREKKLLPDFEEIDFKNRKVFIILDSDARRKNYENI